VGLPGDDERRGLGARPARRGGLEVEVADARKVKNVAPLACKTDKVDACSLSAMPDSLPASSSRASARAQASARRPARARCASPPSRPPRAPGARPTPGTGSTRTCKARTGKANPAKSAVARKVLIACWHVLSGQHPSAQPPAQRSCPGKLQLLSGRLTARTRIEKPGQLPSEMVRRERRKRNERSSTENERG
jgi:hypothetical protein